MTEPKSIDEAKSFRFRNTSKLLQGVRLNDKWKRKPTLIPAGDVIETNDEINAKILRRLPKIFEEVQE